MQSHDALITADKAHTWHPFTQMADWCAPEHEPLMLVSGEGALLRDSLGRDYIDGNSSIWTNLHGHRHPRLDAALQRQVGRVAHTSFLGFSNPPAARLAQELVELWPPGTLTRVFFSDDGSTAVEVALKIAAQFWQQRGEPKRQTFVAFSGAYHGDTMGASSLGGIGAFHERFAAWQFPVVRAAGMDELDGIDTDSLAAVIIEPLIQGANQMRLWPAGMLRDLRAWCDRHGVLLILDEVMTGFGRTGTMFACEQEGVTPDLIALAKGLTGGYLPLAATMTTERIYEAFLGGPEKTLYYGHSYTANQLACAVALENLAIFRDERVIEAMPAKVALMREVLEELRSLRAVHEIRQCGFIAGIELRQSGGERFPAERRVGTLVCLAARAHGLLTRPILDTLVLLPAYCITEAQLRQAASALRIGIDEVCG
jgi:adenosylmethionine-8-amino-7-oxononanoate aminotransferase